MDPNNMMFSSDWQTMIHKLSCDKCKTKYTGTEMIYTNYDTDYCKDCYNENENKDKFILMTSRERTEKYCEEQMKKFCDIMGLIAAPKKDTEVAVGGIDYSNDGV